MSNETTKTSQSIFVILDSLETETSVPGQTPKMQRHTLPREMFPTSEQFESEHELHQWAVHSGCLHAVLQKGIKAHLIDCRAKFKACKKGDEWSNEYGQKNLNGFKWEVQARPNGNTKGDDAAIIAIVGSIKTMLGFNLTPEQIREGLYKENPKHLVDKAFEKIEEFLSK